MNRHLATATVLLALLGMHGAWAQSSCGDLGNAYGPFDYRTDRHKLGIVEQFHFTPEVEALIRGKSSPIVGNDLDYTLRAFPNHHRALAALTRHGQRTKSPQPAGLRYPVDCYFERAVRFRPDDTTVRILLAGHLFRTGRTDEALVQLRVAGEAASTNGFTHYNIGLAYFDMKRYDKALEHAHRAMQLGFVERQELKKQLEGIGRWVEPAGEPATPAQPAS